MATPPAGDADPSYWDERFDKLERKLQTFQATCVRNSTEAAAKVATTLARETAATAAEVRRELVAELAVVKKRSVVVQDQLVEINASLSKLATGKFLQQAFTGLLLGCLFVFIFNVVHG